jgi:salicylate hydroxylase
MHPNAAQGFSQIAVDIAVLDYLITQDNSAIANMAVITSDWEKMRKLRVKRIKMWAKANSELFTGQPPTGTRHADNWRTKSLKNTRPDMKADMNSSAFLKWAQSHDAIGQVK